MFFQSMTCFNSKFLFIVSQNTRHKFDSASFILKSSVKIRWNEFQDILLISDNCSMVCRWCTSTVSHIFSTFPFFGQLMYVQNELCLILSYRVTTKLSMSCSIHAYSWWKIFILRDWFDAVCRGCASKISWIFSTFPFFEQLMDVQNELCCHTESSVNCQWVSLYTPTVGEKIFIALRNCFDTV